MKQQLRKPTHNRLLPVRAKSRRHAWQLMSRVIPLVVLSIASCWWMLAMSPAMGQFPSPPSTTPAPFQPVNQNFNASGTPTIPSTAIPSTDFQPSAAAQNSDQQTTADAAAPIGMESARILERSRRWLVNAAAGALSDRLFAFSRG